MSKVFYDKLVALEHIEKEVNKIAQDKEEKEELWHIIDEYVHHRVMGCILGKLPHQHHEEFLTKFVDAPHHDQHWDYLKEKISQDFEDFVRAEIELIGTELLGVIRSSKSGKKNS